MPEAPDRSVKRAVSYLRVSGLGQVDGDGFERQRQSIARFAAATGLVVAEEFHEDGVSGATDLDDRPALLAALTRVTEGDAKVVVVERADRLARDLMVQEAIVRQFADAGARLLTADGVDLTDDGDPTRRLLRQIVGAVAEWEKRCTVIKLRAARERMRRTKGYCEGRKPFGLGADEAETLDRMRRLRASHTFAGVADALNAEERFTKAGRPWSASTVYRTMRRAEASRETAELFQA